MSVVYQFIFMYVGKSVHITSLSYIIFFKDEAGDLILSHLLKHYKFCFHQNYLQYSEKSTNIKFQLNLVVFEGLRDEL